MRKDFVIFCSHAESLINFRSELIGVILERGFSVHIIAPESSFTESNLLYFSKNNIRVHQLPMSRTGINPFVDLSAFFSLLLILIEVKPYALFSYTIKPVIFGNLARFFARIPHSFSLITGLGYIFTSLDRKSFLFRLVVLLYRVSLNLSSCVFFQNQDDRNMFLTLNILKPESPRSLVINGSGVNLQKFYPVSLPNGVSFLMIARLLKSKGVREYFHAASRVRSVDPNVKFHLVGWIDDNPDSITHDELNSWIESNVITFHGKLRDVRDAISNSCVYVLPSYREGTPRTVLEAMAMGRPIITSDAPGCRETVVDGENGFLVPVKSVDELIVAMQKFIDQPELIVQMGKRSRYIAEVKYDVNKVNEKMLIEMGIK